MANIKQMPSYLRPREKAYRYGLDSLSDHELLAIILGSGTKENNVLILANDLLNDYGGLYSLSNAKSNDLLKYKGLGKVKCITLLTMFELLKRINYYKIEEESPLKIDAEFIGKKYLIKLANLDRENLYIIVIDHQGKISFETALTLGSDVAVKVYLREIKKIVYSHNGSGYYLVHNHPSGNTAPSVLDDSFCLALSDIGKKIGLKLLGLIIIGKGKYSLVNQMNTYKF